MALLKVESSKNVTKMGRKLTARNLLLFHEDFLSWFGFKLRDSVLEKEI